jgi:hypothetical protein
MNTFRNMLLGHRWKRLFVRDGKSKYRNIHNYLLKIINYGGKQTEEAENRVKSQKGSELDLGS